MEVKGNQNCLVTSILQNIFFSVPAEERISYTFGKTHLTSW